MIAKRRRKNDADQAPGQDSFLDIVANLVGILIILVVVVGAHAGTKLQRVAAKGVDRGEIDALQRELETTAATALSMQRHNLEVEQQIVTERNLTQMRQSERDRLLVAIEQVRRRLRQHSETQSVERQQALQQRAKLDQKRKEMEQIQREFTFLKSAPNQTKQIEHYPTPIAKTVFSDEVHFRLLGGRLAPVPLGELVELMRNEWREKAKKLDRAEQTIETVGPIGGFRLQYQLELTEVAHRTAVGNLVRKATEFKRFVLVPTSETLGQPLDQALIEGSEFRGQVDRLNPVKTTVSVWVYPDSFAEFNQLKTWLYKRGFQTACWPLSAGNLISGGPSGYRSTAQ